MPVMAPEQGEVAQVDISEVRDLLDRLYGALTPDEHQLLVDLLSSYTFFTKLVEQRDTTIASLRHILFGARTEKASEILPEGKTAEAAANDGEGSPPEEKAHEDPKSEDRPKRKGHGRNGAKEYVGAEVEAIPHECLKPGDPCPECDRGKVYELAEPKRLVRVTGQPPLGAKVFELDRLRCNLCGEVFCAACPEGVAPKKYDAAAAGMIAVLKYGSGLPFNRLQGLQADLGIPLPASTQWDIVLRLATELAPVHEELIRQAAQGDVLHNDDTTMRILEFMGKRRTSDGDSGRDSERKGIFTSGIVSLVEGRRIVVFFTGRRHAGERLEEVLALRAAELAAPIQMCDALKANVPKDFAVILANCLVHGRRNFVKVAGNFPVECRFVIAVLGRIYEVDAEAREEGLTPEERLELHREKSQRPMDKLERWLQRNVDERTVEPNSGLGKAIAYMLKHWDALTLFLHVAGAPLDNNSCERALKKAILHRKAALFYRSQKGAEVGDLFMSLIHTAELAGASSFEYLTALQKHREEAQAQPAEWMPWNYQATLRSIA